MNATLQVQTNGDPSGGLYAVCSLVLRPAVDSLALRVAESLGKAVATRLVLLAQADGVWYLTPMQTAAWGVIGAALVGGIAAL
jgi:hypothetical protein